MISVTFSGVSKRYGSSVALEDVSVEIERGTIHAIVGENGAGKTTLVKALYGAMIPDSGSIAIDGIRQSFTNSKQAIAAGVGMVSQHYGIIGELSNLENLILGDERGARLNRDELEAAASALAGKMGFTFDWQDRSAHLSPAAGQKLEILKLLWRNARIMILDEPTAMLSPRDADALFASMRQLALEDKTVIVVTHRLSEVFDYCQRVTVLRGGRKVADHSVSEVDAAQLAREIVGGEVHERPVPSVKEGTRVRLELADLVVNNDQGAQALKGIHLQAHEGEIVGIAGVDGNGQRELFQALIGLRKPAQGSILFDGHSWIGRSTAERLQTGLRIIAEDRLSEAVIESWSLEENARLGLHRLPSQVDAQAIADRFATKHGGLASAIGSLSGGNQQRFVAARALALHPQLILAFAPARGLDLNSTTNVYRGIRAACEAGACAIVVSFDLDELLDFCDRIVVMCHGRIGEPDPSVARDRDAIGRLMVGVA